MSDSFDVLKSEAARIGVDYPVLRAVVEAESSGKAFAPDGKIVLRFEPHVFARLTAQKKLGLKGRPTPEQTRANGAIVLLPGMKEATSTDARNRTGGQASEWEAYGRASAIDHELAAQSASWGLGQIMGFNFKATGHANAVAMVAAFSASAENQIKGMVNFINSNKNMVAALKSKDLPAFVAIYNGAPVGDQYNTRYVKRMEDKIRALTASA